MKPSRSDPTIIASDAGSAGTKAAIHEWQPDFFNDAHGDRSDLWQALHELIEREDFQDHLQASFPQLARAATLDRRNFLRFMGASLALAGVTACSGPPPEDIVPWVQAPTPNGSDAVLPRYYATALESAGYGVGVLVKSHTGRPIPAIFIASEPTTSGFSVSLTK